MPIVQEIKTIILSALTSVFDNNEGPVWICCTSSHFDIFLITFLRNKYVLVPFYQDAFCENLVFNRYNVTLLFLLFQELAHTIVYHVKAHQIKHF